MPTGKRARLPRKGDLVRRPGSTRVWLVTKVEKAIKGRDHESSEVSFWQVTPSSLVTAEVKGDPVVVVCRLEKAKDLHPEGAKANVWVQWYERSTLTLVDDQRMKEST